MRMLAFATVQPLQSSLSDWIAACVAGRRAAVEAAEAVRAAELDAIAQRATELLREGQAAIHWCFLILSHTVFCSCGQWLGLWRMGHAGQLFHNAFSGFVWHRASMMRAQLCG